MSDLTSLLKGGKHGPAIVPSRAADSLLIQYIKGVRTPKMPLSGSLPAATVAALADAIDRMEPVAAQPKNAHLDWLFRKPSAPPVPHVRGAAWVRNPIDAFILEKLEARGFEPAPPASPAALIRRVYLDLIGLPPPPDAVQRFVAEPSDSAYEKLVDGLLADRRYGERWARYWLDLARFAESDGFAIDGERPTAWRYRDYVIRSLNADKPYDVFVKEQIAGDEMTGNRGASDSRSERLVALGFLRMGTWEADANFKTQLRQDVLNDMTASVAQVFLGLTVGCARCHDHKYDPIPQRDFYRMQAFLAATRVEDRPAPFLESEKPKLMKQLFRQYEDEAETATAEFKIVEDELKKRAPKDFARIIKDRKDETYTAAERRRYEEARDRARRLGEMAPRHRAMAYSVSDVVPPQVPEVAGTWVLAGGELSGRGEKVEPGFPVCLGGDRGPAKIPFAGGSSGRRTALAEWIASAENPLTARVMVNRLWQSHFGNGIVRTASDFGVNGDRPSHPELLDWLAVRFVEGKWSLKAMHKLMLLSATYRQSSDHPKAAEPARVDADNRLLWRMNWRRVEAEALRDSILEVSGTLQKVEGGPGVFVDIPQDVAEGFEFFKWFPSDRKDQSRRTIYTFQRRSVMLPMVEVFDGANMNESCSRRNTTTVAPQSFTLLNGDLTQRASEALAARVAGEAGPDAGKQVERAFWLALGRAPTDAEKASAVAMPVRALAAVLFNLNEFVYVE
jgi:hypothetical protein